MTTNMKTTSSPTKIMLIIMAQHASLTYVSVTQQSTPEGCTDCPVGKVDQDIYGTRN